MFHLTIYTTTECYIELSGHSPLAQQESLTPDELKALPCILIGSSDQRENERAYYREIVGLDGGFLFSDNLGQARLLAAGGKGHLPVEGIPKSYAAATPLHRIPLLRGGQFCELTALSGKLTTRIHIQKSLRRY